MTRTISDRLAAALLGATLLATPLAVMAQAQAPMTSPAPAASTAQAPAASTKSARTAQHNTPDRVAQRIESLHRQLKITPDQSNEWNAVAQAMKDNAASMQSLSQERTAKEGKMSAVDDLHSYEQIADAHSDGLKKLVPAFEALYAKMTPAQQKNADAIFAHRTQRVAHNAAKRG
jgi:periplasmic protein CpxP/Spy